MSIEDLIEKRVDGVDKAMAPNRIRGKEFENEIRSFFRTTLKQVGIDPDQYTEIALNLFFVEFGGEQFHVPVSDVYLKGKSDKLGEVRRRIANFFMRLADQIGEDPERVSVWEKLNDAFIDCYSNDRLYITNRKHIQRNEDWHRQYKLWRDGKSIAEIAKAMNCSKRQAYKVIRAFRGNNTPVGRPKKGIFRDDESL